MAVTKRRPQRGGEGRSTGVKNSGHYREVAIIGRWPFNGGLTEITKLFSATVFTTSSGEHMELHVG